MQNKKKRKEKNALKAIKLNAINFHQMQMINDLCRILLSAICRSASKCLSLKNGFRDHEAPFCGVFNRFLSIITRLIEFLRVRCFCCRVYATFCVCVCVCIAKHFVKSVKRNGQLGRYRLKNKIVAIKK